MRRKLVKQGLRALTITVPSEWVKKNGLKAGGEVDIVETEAGLAISTEHQKPIKEITVDVSGLLPRLADRFMARSYQKGYDKITLIFDNPEIMHAVQNKVSELMGFEVLNVEKNKIDVQVISTDLMLNFDIILRRALLLLMEMSKTCHDSWKKKDKAALENITHQDFDVNKFTYFCLRELNKSQKMMSFGSSILYYLIESLEDLGDELKHLGRVLAKLKPEKNILEIIGKMNEMFRISYEFFYTPKKESAVKAFKLYKEIKSQIEENLGAKSKEMTKALISIEFSVRIIYHLTTMRLDTLKELRGNK